MLVTRVPSKGNTCTNLAPVAVVEPNPARRSPIPDERSAAMATLTATDRRTRDELDCRGGREGRWDRRGVVPRGNGERLPAGRRRNRVPDRRAMGRRVVVAGALSHPHPGGASERPGALQRHGDRQLEQRLGRREFRASEERGARASKTGSSSSVSPRSGSVWRAPVVSAEPGSRCRRSRRTTRSGTDRWSIPVTTTRSTSSPRPRSCWDRTVQASRTRCPASRCAMSSPPGAHSPALGS